MAVEGPLCDYAMLRNRREPDLGALEACGTAGRVGHRPKDELRVSHHLLNVVQPGRYSRKTAAFQGLALDHTSPASRMYVCFQGFQQMSLTTGMGAKRPFEIHSTSPANEALLFM